MIQNEDNSITDLCDVFTPFRVICSIFRRLFVEQISLIDSGYAGNAKQKDWIVVSNGLTDIQLLATELNWLQLNWNNHIFKYAWEHITTIAPIFKNHSWKIRYRKEHAMTH